MYKGLLAAVVGTVALTASFCGGQEKGKDAKSQPGSDKEFVQKASEDGLAEVNHGNLAARKASRKDVREFAQRMVKDHGKANAELLALANKKQLKVARDMGKEHKAMQDKLAGMSGEDFDRHYIHHMVEGHEKAVALFQGQTQSGKDEDLKKFAEKSLPVLQEHLKMARDIHGRLKEKK